MIEKVMNERETQNTTDIRIPKNIKQIGENSKHRKVYVEESVMNEIKKKPDDEDKVKYGTLLGEIKRSKGITYIFVKGIIETRDVIENSIIFNDDIWADIYKDIKQYYSEGEIVGWFVNVPYTVTNEMNSLKKLHLDNFAGNDKVCFISDRSENEDGFFAYEGGELKKQSGYYIFFEKNEKVKKYIQQIQSQKSKIGANASTTSGVGEQSKHMSFREMLKQQLGEESEGIPAKGGKLTYAMSSMLIIALLLSTVVMMNNYGELKNLKTSIEGMNSNDNIVAVNEMLSSFIPAQNDTLNENATDGQNTSLDPDGEEVNNGVSDIEETESSMEYDDGISETDSILDQDFGSETGTASWESTTEDARGASGSIYSGMYHTVKKGQTLYDISVKYYGDNSMVEELKELNDIDDDYLIKEGQTILLP